MSIARIGMIGAGTMGAGIATNAAQNGIDVLLTDQSLDLAEKAKAGAAKFYARQQEKGRMSEGEVADALARIKPVAELSDLAPADLIIEAIFEDFDIKADLFKKLQNIRRDDALVATNTSCLRVSDLQEHDRLPERFLGMHYFSPAQVNPIVEVVEGAKTDPSITDSTIEFCERTKKQPIRCKDSFGFAINRFFCPYTNEAAKALDAGLGTPNQIDAVAKDCLGAAAGPFQVMNLIKPRINLHAIRNLGPLGQFYAPAASMTKMGEADASWELDDAPALDSASAAKIADMLRCGAFLPVLQALDENVANPGAFDLGARQALKISRAPCALMDELGQAEVERIIAPVLAQYGIEKPRSVAKIGQLTA